MATEIAYKVSVETEEGGKSLKSLKEEFRNAQKELDGLTVGTSEYVKALSKLGNTKAEIKDLNETINAFDPDAKMKAFSGVTRGLASGIQGAVGAMALFGVESKDTEKMLLKVQAASAFSEGINGVLGMGDAFKNLQLTLGKTAIGQKLVTAGQWLWNAAMEANPIGLIIIGITALVAAFAVLSTSQESAAEKQVRLNELEKEAAKKVDEYVASLEKKNAAISKSNDFEIERLKAKGATEEEIYAAEKKRDDARRAQLMYIKGYRGDLNAAESAELLELTRKQTLAIDKIEGDSKKKSAEEEKKATEESIANKKALKEKEAAYLKSLSDKALAEQKKNDADELAATTSLIDKVKALKEAEDLRLAGSEQAKLQIQKDKDIAAIEAEYAKSDLLAGAQKARTDALFLIDQKYLDDVNTANKASNDKKLADDKIAADKKIALEKKKEDDIIKMIQDGLDSAQALSDIAFVFKMNSVKKGSKEEEKIAKQQFEVNKALQIANTVVNTIVGVRNALIPKPAESPLEMGLRIANAVSIGIGGVAAIAKISATKFGATGGNVGGVDGGGAGGGATAPAIAPPSNGSTMLNPDGTVKAPTNQQSVVKAIVVETDITKTQRNINSIETSARL